MSVGKSSVKQRPPAARGKAKPAGKTAAKARPAAAARTTRSAKAAKPAKRAAKPAPKKPAKAAAKPPAKPAAKLAATAPAKVSSKPAPKAKAAPVAPPESVAPPAPPPPPKKPSFYEAIGIYEAGVRGLQRHDYAGAAESFRQVLQRYPEERELIERAQLYLRVCERETAQRPAGPKTTAERVYAATMSLSAGDVDAALGHVKGAIEQEPTSHHAHYMMAVIRSTRGETDQAVEHLRRAIELNPDSRSIAKQDGDLERLRQHPTVRALLDEHPGQPKVVARPRR